LLAIKAYEAISDSADNATVDDANDCESRGRPKKAALGDPDDEASQNE